MVPDLMSAICRYDVCRVMASLSLAIPNRDPGTQAFHRSWATFARQALASELRTRAGHRNNVATQGLEAIVVKRSYPPLLAATFLFCA